MNTSRQEEIISALWIIASLISFGNDFTTWGWIFAIKGGMDVAISIWYAGKDALRNG